MQILYSIDHSMYGSVIIVIALAVAMPSLAIPQQSYTPQRQRTGSSPAQSGKRVSKKNTATKTSPLKNNTIRKPATDTTIVHDSSTVPQPVKKPVRTISVSTDSAGATLSDSLRSSQSQSGIDTTVTYYAKDTAVFYVKEKRLRLRGDANVNFKKTNLKSELIEIYFDKNSMQANGAPDSTGKNAGYPVFTDDGKSYAGETIKYNFRNKAGTVSLGETTIENGYYFGSRIKRVDEGTMYVENGCYTTCNHPHPHFYFASPRMKVQPGDRIFMDNIYLYVQDIPILYLPFGFFFPNQGGRQSGLMIPRPFVSASRGVVFQDLGYYFALSDNWGAKLAFDIFSKGGITTKLGGDYNYRYLMNGALNLNYSYVRDNPAQDYTQQYSVSWQHQQTIIPNTTQFNANVNFQTNGFIRTTQQTLSQRITQNVRSAAGLSHTFDNGIGLTLSYTRDQDIVQTTYNNAMSASMTIPALFPLREIAPSGSWLRDFSITLGTSINSTYNKVQVLTTRRIDTVRTAVDTSFTNPYTAVMRINPSISIAPRLGFFTITPSINVAAQLYTRRIVRSWNAADKREVTTEEGGIFNELTTSAGIGLRTTLYGSALRIANVAVRHTIIPSVSLNFSPDLSLERYGYYGYYQIPADSINRTAQTVRYSRYALDGGGIASQNRSLSLGFNIDNALDAKVFGDSADTKIELARIGVSGGYNFVADSLGLSDLNWSVRTPTIGNLNFSTGFATTYYDEDPVRDTSGRATGSYRRVNRTLLSSKGIGYVFGRVTNFTINLSTSFSAQGAAAPTPTAQRDTTRRDTLDTNVGSRFTNRMNYEDKESDVFGNESPGYSPLVIPWNVSFNLSYSYNKPSAYQEGVSVFNASSQISFNLTQTWSVRTGLSYDFTQNQINAPNLTVTKQIHCWALDFTWYPTGFNQGFYLRFAASDAMLRDLQIEKRSAPIFR